MKIKSKKRYRFKSSDRLWRYIDLHQLLYFINTKSIFFAPLSSFDDPLEGISEKYLYGRYTLRMSGLNDKLEKLQQFVYASCWFFGDTESMAMWQTHSNPDSVAIEFKASDLVKLILSQARKLRSKDFPLLYHGKVEYIKLSPVDRKSLKRNTQQMMGFLKDKSYKHEEEFRFIVLQSKGRKKMFRGFDLPVESLQSMEFNIVTHPEMETWKHDNLRSVLKNFSLEGKLKMSSIVKRK
jgi:Protein of unknown function (DUF2971)